VKLKMGQWEVFDFLKKEALAGRRRWWSAREIEKASGLKVVSGHLILLAAGGFVVGRFARSSEEFPGRVRIKKKYLKT